MNLTTGIYTNMMERLKAVAEATGLPIDLLEGIHINMRATSNPQLTNYQYFKAVIDAVFESIALTPSLLAEVNLNPEATFFDFVCWFIFCITHPDTLDHKYRFENGKVFLPDRNDMYVGPVWVTRKDNGLHDVYYNLYMNCFSTKKKLEEHQYFVINRVASLFNCAITYRCTRKEEATQEEATQEEKHFYSVCPLHLMPDTTSNEEWSEIRHAQALAASSQPATFFMRQQRIKINTKLTPEELQVLNQLASMFGAEIKSFHLHQKSPSYELISNKVGAAPMEDMPGFEPVALLESIGYPDPEMMIKDGGFTGNMPSAQSVVDYIYARMISPDKYKVLLPHQVPFIALSMEADMILQMFLLKYFNRILNHGRFVVRPNPGECAAMHLAIIQEIGVQ